MKNYHEMSDYETNVAVAKLVIWRNKDCEDVSYNNNLSKVSWGDGANWREFDPCNNPSDAWPIIFDNKIAVAPYILGESSIDYKEFEGKWFAMSLVDESWDDLNPLRAAMIVFLMMKDKENS